MTTSIGRQTPVRSLRVLALAAATTVVLPIAAASAAPAALKITSTVPVTGTMSTGSLGQPVSAEAPDGSVYVASLTTGKQTVWVAARTGKAHIADRVTGVGTITALAADTTYLYVGTPSAISAYRRTNGALVRRWVLSPKPRVLTQLAVAGNRVWGLLTPTGYTRKPSSLVEINPASATRVRTVNGVSDAASIAASSSAIYYVTDKSSTLVRLSNTGVTKTAKTHQVVNQELSGPAAIQAVLVDGNTLVVRYNFGQGTDAKTIGYNATTLAGPGKSAGYSAAAALAKTSLGLLEQTSPADTVCASTTHACLSLYGLGAGGAIGKPLTISGDVIGTPMGPYPAIVTAAGSTLHILRIG